jgi:hypothetical protein
MSFIAHSPKPLQIRALAVPNNNATSFASWDNTLTQVHKLGSYFNNGLSILDLVTMVGETIDRSACDLQCLALM